MWPSHVKFTPSSSGYTCNSSDVTHDVLPNGEEVEARNVLHSGNSHIEARRSADGDDDAIAAIEMRSSVPASVTNDKLNKDNEGLPADDNEDCSLITLLTTDETLYRFACLTGFILPHNDTHSPVHTLSATLWVYFMHFSVFIYVVIAVLYGAAQIVLPPSANQFSFGYIVGIEMLASALPFVTMYPGVMRIRLGFAIKRENVTRTLLRTAARYSVPKGYRIFLVISVINIISLTTTAVYFSLHANNNKSGGILGSVLFGIVTIIPSNLMLSGLYSFLLIEQRISFAEIVALQEELLHGRLTDRAYLSAGRRIEKRDRESPIDLLLLTATAETVLCIVLLVVLAVFGNGMHADTLTVNVLFVLSSFCKEIIIFVSMLYQVMRVNEIVDVMLQKLSFDSDSLLSSIQATDTTQAMLQRIQRIELFVAMKEYRVGSTIMHYRPSRGQLLFQILSVGFALFTTISKVLVNIAT